MNPVFVKARDISDAWHQLIYKLVGSDSVASIYTIEQGSYVGDQRLEFDYVTVHITHPCTRPLEPKLPPAYGIPDPVAPDYIDKYLPYLMTGAKAPGEDYTYGERISGYRWSVAHPQPEGGLYYSSHLINQIEHFIELLRSSSKTNQAILQVGQPQDCELADPPCLRHIDLRVAEGRLHFFPYFRSWDLWGGFPANLGGLVHLMEYMADAIGVQPGEIIAASKGLHLYSYVWELGRALRGQ